MAPLPPNLQMRQATLADLEGICTIYFEAFSHSYILQNCFPRSSPEVRTFVAAARKKDLLDPSHKTLVVIDTSKNDKIVAVAIWEVPHQKEEKEAKEDVAWPRDGNPELAAAFFGGINRKRREVMGDRGYWHLHLIGVLPEYQKKSVSTPLLNWGIERAEEDGLPVYLDSTPGARDVYLRFGLKVVDTLDFNDGKMIMSMMLKE